MAEQSTEASGRVWPPILGAVFLLAFAWFFLTSKTRFDGTMPLVYLGVGLLLMLFPFIKSFKVANLLELEKQVKETKVEVKETRDEFRSTMNALSASIQATVQASANVQQTFVFNPPPQDAQDARQGLEEAERSKKRLGAQVVQPSIDLKDVDQALGLARTRMTLERALRLILRKSTTPVVDGNEGTRFLGLNTLVNQFLKENPDYESLRKSMAFAIQTANAGIHGQKVPSGVAQEAIEIGERTIKLLVENFHLRSEDL
jgi:hypothetical protein